MKRHAIDCTCYDEKAHRTGKAIVCGTKGQSIVYYCHNCCKQYDVPTQGKERVS